jgi:hypothetical protein
MMNWNLAILVGALVALRADPAVTWRTTLAPPPDADPRVAAPAGVPVGGAATIESAGAKRTRANVHIVHAAPGGVHPWHVHRGSCGNDQGIVGPATGYTPLHVGPDGEGEVAQTLAFPTPTDGQYMVNVHASPTNLKTIVACGNLTRE